MDPAVVSTVPGAMPRAVSPQPQTPLLSVVIVNYRQWRNTARLAGQLLSGLADRDAASEVVIVDNGSPAHRLRRRLRRTEAVSLRCWGRNLGFSRGVNEGCRLSRGDWFLLLNPDVTVEPGFLGRVHEHINRLSADDSNVGVVGFQILDRGGQLQPSAGQFPGFLGTLLGVLRKRSARKCRLIPDQRPRRVQWVTGCCLLIRRECFEQVGGFDRDFFLYYEDVDFCRRATQAGWSVWYEPQLRITHHHPLHGRKVPPRLRLLTRHALLSYAEKHWRRWQFQVLALIVWLEALVRRKREQVRGDESGAAVLKKLGRLALDMFRGRRFRARRRLLGIVGRGGGKVRRSEGRPKPDANQSACKHAQPVRETRVLSK
jgi:GT2 family glycosyltransferase